MRLSLFIFLCVTSFLTISIHTCYAHPFVVGSLERGKTYVIKKEIDLDGKTLTIPDGCTLLFKRKGAISNGRVEFNNTILKRRIRFQNCIYSGTVYCGNDISDKCFTGDDTVVLRWLIENAAATHATLTLNRDYVIDLNYRGEAYVQVVDNHEGFFINGNGHRVSDNYNPGKNWIKYLIRLVRCDNVTVSNMEYCSNKLDPSSFPIHYGLTVVRTDGDCYNCTFSNITGYHLDAVVRAGDYSYSNHITDGLADSRIEVKAYNCSYPLAIYGGTRLDIFCQYDTVHRGAYLSGLSDSKIHSIGRGYNKTRVYVYLKDCIHYAKDDPEFKNPIFVGCQNLDITSVVEDGDDMLARCCMISDYGKEYHYADRREPELFTGINLKVICGIKPSLCPMALLVEMPPDNGVNPTELSVRLHDTDFNSQETAVRMMGLEHVNLNLTVENCNLDSNLQFDKKNDNSRSTVEVYNTSFRQLTLLGTGCIDIIMRDSDFQRTVNRDKAKVNIIRR